MVDMKAKPFYLSDEDCKWVEETIAGMTTEEKIGQLFFNMGSSRDEEYLKMTVDKYHIGGIRYNPATGAEVREQNRILQENSKIPLIIACNTENGGNGACTDGTMIGQQTKIGATRDARYAYELGRMSNKEAAAIGCNLSFAPVSDILYNWENPVIGLRTYGNDVDRVCEMTKAYMDGAHTNEGFCCAAKHFPGDGLDFRDQHVADSVNDMSCEEWDASYGKVYQNLIDNGLEAIMAGHIMQPAYTRHFNPGIKDEDIMPGTLSREMMQGLLRGELGFNGLICTDATTMAGYTLAMSRRRAVPESIARGADMFLFARNLEEDYGFMLQGIKDGIITPERLDEAVTRILATKAALGLHRGAPELDVEKAKTIVGCAKHQQWAEECADKAITLVKEQPGVLPITPERYKKILFYTIEPAAGGEGNYKVAPACAKLRAMLGKEGFEIDDFVPQPYGEGFTTKYEEVVNNYDLILYVANLSTKSNQTVVRIEWKQPMGADCGHYMNDIPTVFVSLENPYHLQDFPRVKTYINCYSNNDHCLHQLIEKLTGRSTFKGHSPVDAFCGKWDAHL
mgnify:CR=1 FL=1